MVPPQIQGRQRERAGGGRCLQVLLLLLPLPLPLRQQRAHVKVQPAPAGPKVKSLQPGKVPQHAPHLRRHARPAPEVVIARQAQVAD